MRIWLVLSVLFAATNARAECAIRQWVGAASGTKIPNVGSLYLFREIDPEGVKIEWLGEPGSTSVHAVDDSVVRIDYHGFAGSTLIVDGFYEESSRYQLVADWTPPAEPPRALTYWHHVESWTCSWADSLIVQIDQTTAAVRARWTYHGRAVDYLVPAQTEESKAIVELGKLDCAGANIPPDQLHDGGELVLSAIRFDGSEVPIRGMRRWVSTQDLRLDERGIDAAMSMIVLQEHAKQVAKQTPSRYLGVLVIAILGLGILLAVRLAGRSASDCSRALE